MAEEEQGTEAVTADPVEDQNRISEEIQEDAPAIDEAAEEEAREKLRREREARAQALTLEIVGDLPYAEVKPPENVLFVCKLNPVTEDEDLDLIFSRFGKIISCEVIRDKRTKESLQYAFIEFENQKDCEQAYFKMQGVLIDDHRIHVDFSQSVSRLSDTWRSATNSRRAKQGGGFGGIAHLEKKRQYRAADPKHDYRESRSHGYGMVFDKDTRQSRPQDSVRDRHSRRRSRSRSRSPRSGESRRQRTPPLRQDGEDSYRHRGYRSREHEERNRRR